MNLFVPLGLPHKDQFLTLFYLLVYMESTENQSCVQNTPNLIEKYIILLLRER